MKISIILGFVLLSVCCSFSFENDPVIEFWIGKSTYKIRKYPQNVKHYKIKENRKVGNIDSSVLGSLYLVKDHMEIKALPEIRSQLELYASFVKNKATKDVVFVIEDGIPNSEIIDLIETSFHIGYTRVILYSPMTCVNKNVQVFIPDKTSKTINYFQYSKKTMRIKLAHKICESKRSAVENECEYLTVNYLDKPCP